MSQWLAAWREIVATPIVDPSTLEQSTFVGLRPVGAPIPAQILDFAQATWGIARDGTRTRLRTPYHARRVDPAEAETEGPVSRVWLRREQGRVLVFEAECTVGGTTSLTTARGTWVAFHHNLREDTLEADLTKWIALRFVDTEGAVFEVDAAMTDRDRDREGEEQGFEFPALVPLEDGGLILFGRGSHTFFAQRVDEHGFDPRVPLDDGRWGCRGTLHYEPFVRPELEDPALAERRIVRLDRRGLVYAWGPLPHGGPPPLRPATVRVLARPHRGRPRRLEGADLAEPHGLITLFGDLHQHSAHSDGVGTADEPYRRARYVYGDDFCALSDHESFLGKRIGHGEWTYLADVADAHDEPGVFATLYAYEWTGKAHPGPGHKCVYSDRRIPIVSRDEVPTGSGLAQHLRALGAIAVPHHVGWTGADLDAHSEDIQPVWEICSCHGCYLHAEHALGQRGDLRDQMVEAVLRSGRRFGFIAGSDGHGLLYHHGVARKRDCFRTGLTAVLAKARTRSAIVEALRARRCYATSGVPIGLDVDAEGHPMGTFFDDRAAIDVRIRARGTAPLRELAWVTEHGSLGASVIRGQEAELTITARSRWGYAKVVQEDGEMAWSSPIFLGRSDQS